MAAGRIGLPISAALPGDGSPATNPANLIRLIGTEAGNPKKTFLAAAFDPIVIENLWWQFRLPADYVSAPILKLLWTIPSLVAGNVVWGGRIAAITPGDVDTPIDKASASPSSTTTAVNATEVRRLTETIITLGSDDGAVAGDLVFMHVYRQADSGSDTYVSDAELVLVTFHYS